MKITYVARSFLDYRIPVLQELHRLLNGQFNYIYSADYVPARCQTRLTQAIGNSAIGLHGELRIGPDQITDFANRQWRLVYQPKLYSTIRSTSPDVVVGDGFFQWTAFALAYRALNPVGLVVCYERTSHTERSAQRLRTVYRKSVLQLVDAMAVNGSLSKEYAVSLGMHANSIVEGQMAADSHALSEKAKLVDQRTKDGIRKRWGSPDIAFVTVGRLIPLKGFRQLLLGWQRLEQHHHAVAKLIIVGDGEDAQQLQELANDLRLRRVEFLGHVNYEQIAGIYAASDALISATLEDNWSLVVPEAMACGLPILCSKYNGCHPELVRTAINGWIFDPLDPDSTYQALLQCVQHRRELAEMGRQSQNIVASYTPERAAETIIRACQIAHDATNRGRQIP